MMANDFRKNESYSEFYPRGFFGERLTFERDLSTGSLAAINVVLCRKAS